MKRITGLIAEDEAPQRAALKDQLRTLWPELEIVAECEDGLSALEMIQSINPTVAFIDIRMPGLSGLEIARATTADTLLVFTTAYDEYAVQAFEEGAIDYVLKPIRPERLAKTLDRVRTRIDAPHVQPSRAVEAFDLRSSDADAAKRIRWITASAGATTKLFPIEDVLFFKAQDKYTCVATAEDRAHIRTPLKELLEGLDSQVFWQVHRSVIVRATAIRSVKKTEDGKLMLSLKGSNEELPVSSAFQHRFKPM